MSTGREQAAAASKRKDSPRNFWKGDEPPLRFGRDRFRVSVLRGKGTTTLLVDPLVEEMSWSDSQAILSGEITLHRPEGKKPPVIGIGHVVRVEVDQFGRGQFKELWRMRVTEPTRGLQAGTTSYVLADDLDLVNRNRIDVDYRRNKRHPHGWLPHDIAKDAFERVGVPVRKLARTKHPLRRLTLTNSSPLDVVIRAYRHEREAGGLRYVIRMVRGAVEITALKRPDHMLRFGETLVDGSLKTDMKASFATVLTVRSSAGAKRSKKKVVATVRSDKLVRRYGYIHRSVTKEGLDSQAEAARYGRRLLATRAKPTDDVTLTHPGIPSMRRGDAVRLYLPSDNISRIAFVKEVDHTVTPGGYDMDVTVRFDDPYVDVRKKRTKQARCDAARKRGRAAPAGCSKRDRAKAKTNDKRGDAS